MGTKGRGRGRRRGALGICPTPELFEIIKSKEINIPNINNKINSVCLHIVKIVLNCVNVIF
jgi:hypothetical protein